MELLSFKGLTKNEKQKINNLLDALIIVELNQEIKAHAIELRSRTNLKLPDSIIAGTAIFLNLTLFSADIGFKKIEGLHLLLYENN